MVIMHGTRIYFELDGNQTLHGKKNVPAVKAYGSANVLMNTDKFRVSLHQGCSTGYLYWYLICT